MIQERQRVVREAARAAAQLQQALEEGVKGGGRSAGDPAGAGGGRRAPVHGSVPLDVGILDCLTGSLDVVLAEVAAVKEAMAALDDDIPGVGIPAATLQAGFAYLAEHVDEVADELAAEVALTCRREHGRYARTLSGAYGDPPRRCPECGRISLLPESTLAPSGRAHVLVCSTPECDPAPGRWRRYNVLESTTSVADVDHGILVGLKELSALTNVPYRTLDSAVRRARVTPVDTGTIGAIGAIGATGGTRIAGGGSGSGTSTGIGAGTRLFRLADLLTLPALRDSGADGALRRLAG